MPPDPGLTPATGPQPAQIQTFPHEITYLTRQVEPPTPLYIKKDEQIRITALFSSMAVPQNIRIDVRQLNPDGQIVTTRLPMIVTVNGQTLFYRPGECFLLSISAFSVITGPTSPGLLFLQAFIIDNLPTDSTLGFCLFQDYITSSRAASWPNGRSISPQDGPGVLRSITGTVPAAGAEITEFVPAASRWLLISLITSLTTSVTVINRTPTLVIDDGANIYFQNDGFATQAASLTLKYSASSIALSGGAISGPQILPIPSPIWLPKNGRIRTLTTNLQAGDQWTAPQYLVMEWVEI